jgi:hypothetical protein
MLMNYLLSFLFTHHNFPLHLLIRLCCIIIIVAFISILQAWKLTLFELCEILLLILMLMLIHWDIQSNMQSKFSFVIQWDERKLFFGSFLLNFHFDLLFIMMWKLFYPEWMLKIVLFCYNQTKTFIWVTSIHLFLILSENLYQREFDWDICEIILRTMLNMIQCVLIVSYLLSIWTRHKSDNWEDI